MPGTMFYSELFGLLSVEHDTLERILDAATQQQQALIHFDADRIAEIAAEQELCARQIEECELQRIRLVSTTFGISISQARGLILRRLAAMLDQEHAQELIQMREKMNGLSAKIQFVNNVNRVLALRGRNSVNATLEHVRSQRLHVINAKL